MSSHAPAVVVWVPSLGMMTGTATYHLTVAVPNEPVPSAARTVEVNPNSFVAWPEMTPVVALIPSPGGRPVAVHFSVWPAAESVAVGLMLAGTPSQTVL